MQETVTIPVRLQLEADRFQEKYGYNLTAKQAAEFLGTTPGTLAVWRHEGRKPSYVKFGRSVKYPIDTLVDYQLESLVKTS